MTLSAIALALLFAATPDELAVPAPIMTQARTLADTPHFGVAAKDVARWTPAAEPFEMLITDSHVRYDDAGRVVRTSRIVYRLNHASTINAFGTREFEWAAWHQQKPELKVRVVSSTGEERWLDPATISERVGRVQNQVIDDRRTLVAVLPGLTPGALVEEVFVTTDTRPVYPGAPLSGTHRFFASKISAPIQKLVIDAPRAPTLATADWPHAPPKVEQRGDRHIVSVEVLRSGVPRDEARLEWSFGGTWQDAANAYATLIAEPAKVAAPSELAKKGLGIAETMKKVAQKMRYTGLSLGDASVVPYPGPEVWKRGYGDCKDVSLLVVNALEAQGINASLALLRAGTDADVLPNVAGLDRFNHAIVYVHPAPGRAALWIDTTAPELAAGILPDGALDRWALIIHPTLGGTLVKTPDRESQADTINVDTVIEARPMGLAHVREVVTWSGSIASAIAQAQSNEPAAKRLLWVASRFQTQELLTAESKLEGDRSFVATVTFDAPSLAMSFEAGDFPLNHYAHLFQFLPEVEDEEPLRLPRRQKLVHTTRIVPPPGFVITTEGVGDAEVPLGPATWRETFTRHGDALVARAELDLGKLDWSATEVTAFSTAIKAFQGTGLPMIRVVAKSQLLAERGELVDAFATLRDTLEKNPKDADTRARLATLLAESGLGELARTEATRALKDAPKSRIAAYGELFVSMTNPLGESLGHGFDRAWALVTARKVHKAYPQDFSSRVSLAQVLMQGENGGPRLGPDHSAGLDLMKELALEGYDTSMTVWAAGAIREKRWQELKDTIPKLDALEQKNTFLVTAIAATDGPDGVRKALPSMTRNRTEQAELIAAAIGFIALAREYEIATRLSEAFAREHTTLANQALFLRNAKKLPYRNDYSTPEAALGSMFNKIAEGEALPSGDIFAVFGEGTLAMGIDVAWSMGRRLIDGDDAGGWRARLIIDGQTQLDLPTWWRREGDKLVLVAEHAGPALGIEALRRYRAGDVAGAVRWVGWWLEHMATTGKNPWNKRWPDPKALAGAELELVAATLAIGDPEHTASVPIVDKRFAELPSDLRMYVLSRVAKARGATSSAALRTLWEEGLGGESPDMLDWLALSNAFKDAGQMDQALAVIEERRKEAPTDPIWSGTRATLLMQARRYDDAAEAFAELRRSGRVLPATLNNAAWLDLMRGKVSAETAEMARTATTQKADGAHAAQHTLAMVELERGRITEALEAHRHSIRSLRDFAPHNELVQARVADHLGFHAWAKTVYERLTRTGSTDIQVLAKRYLDALPKR